MTAERRLDFAQGDRARKLRMDERHELAFSRQASHTPVSFVVLHDSLKPAPRNLFQ